MPHPTPTPPKAFVLSGRTVQKRELSNFGAFVTDTSKTKGDVNILVGQDVTSAAKQGVVSFFGQSKQRGVKFYSVERPALHKPGGFIPHVFLDLEKVSQGLKPTPPQKGKLSRFTRSEARIVETELKPLKCSSESGSRLHCVLLGHLQRLDSFGVEFNRVAPDEVMKDAFLMKMKTAPHLFTRKEYREFSCTLPVVEGESLPSVATKYTVWEWLYPPLAPPSGGPLHAVLMLRAFLYHARPTSQGYLVFVLTVLQLFNQEVYLMELDVILKALKGFPAESQNLPPKVLSDLANLIDTTREVKGREAEGRVEYEQLIQKIRITCPHLSEELRKVQLHCAMVQA